MLTQPSILQVQGGSTQFTPLAPNLWPSAGQLGDALAFVQQLKALGVEDAAHQDVTNYKDANGNPRNDLPGIFMYLEAATRFWAVVGTFVVKDASGKVIASYPIREYSGQLSDRQVRPSSWYDKPAPVADPSAESPNFFPNGAKLNVKLFADENYATLYWSA